MDHTSGILALAFFVPLLIFCLIFAILLIIAHWKIFTKAGEPGWAVLIPFYGTIVMLKIVGKPWWWLLLMFIPLVNIIFSVWSINMLSKSFGKDEAFTVGLLFLSFIFYPILGFGSAKYMGPYGDPVAYNAYREKQQQWDFDSTKQQ